MATSCVSWLGDGLDLGLRKSPSHAVSPFTTTQQLATPLGAYAARGILATSCGESRMMTSAASTRKDRTIEKEKQPKLYAYA